MYIPKSFEVKDIRKIHDFMETYNFATFISKIEESFEVSHLPTLLDRTQGERGTLSWHMAKQNPQAKAFEGEREILVIFHGPHAYISPTWYKAKPAVPTWNYAVVHAYGVPQKISQEELSRDLTKMIEFHEGKNATDPSYPVTDAYKNELLEHIVGFRMEITRLEGKFKLGQNRPLEDQKGMLEGLKDNGTPEALNLANFMQSLRS